MTSLVLELQRDALNPNVRCSDLLRKAAVVARKLQVKEFAEWIAEEQTGFVGKDVPQYRKIRGQLRVRNPYHGLQPMMFDDPRRAESLSTMPIGQSLSELEDLVATSAKGKQGNMTVNFSPAIESQLVKSMELPMQPLLEIQRASIVGIVEAVRNTILDWSLKLEEQGILGHGMSFTSEERQQAQTTVPTNITNFYGNVSHSQVAPGASAPTQNVGISAVANAELGDLLRDLTDALDKLGASKEDRAEIHAEIATIQAQVASPRPKSRVMAESLHTIRNVLEGAAGSVVASELLPRLITVAAQFQLP